MRIIPSGSITVRVLIPIALILVWLVVGSIGGPTFGKLSGIAKNDEASFLPADADSTKVQNLEAGFIHSQKIPALVIVESQHAFTTADLQQLAGLNARLVKAHGVGTEPGSVLGPLLSTDHKAAEYVVQLQNVGKVFDVITSLRHTVDQHIPTGATGYVTGPAGLAADLFNAFSGIDGALVVVALVAVLVILLLVYRAAVLPFLVLLTAVLALSGAALVVYHSVTAGWLKLNGQSQGILSILVIGAATDYSLLIIARYREALEHNDQKWDAMRHALRNVFEPITASAATVITGVLCLLASTLNSNKDLGPVAALGIAFSYLAAMTVLPALLLLFGRAAFWPFKPKYSQTLVDQLAALYDGLEDRHGLWRAVPRLIRRAPRAVWLSSFVVLAAFALVAPQFKASGIAQTQAILGKSNAVDGQHALERHFPAGSGSPAVIITSADQLPQVMNIVGHTKNVQAVAPYTGPSPIPLPHAKPVVVGGNVMLSATLAVPADSAAAKAVVKDLRSRLTSVDDTLVGGESAITLDTNNAANTDLHFIIPLVLIVILVILIGLLRALVAPLILIGSVILSFTATIGISALLFDHAFRFPGSDAAIPLFAFIFLVALGVDYNIFLMTRVREESAALGTRAGILRGLSVTGSVITSAGIVLAATFAALVVIPVLFLFQIAFIVAFGVLLDTIIVRSLLVPALSYDMGKIIWWPSKLWHHGNK